MQYSVYTFEIEAGEQRDVLTSLLFSDGFEGFEEKKDVLIGYISTENECGLVESKPWIDSHSIPFSVSTVSDSNWNAIWESEFEPVVIENRCFVGASHHIHEADFEFRIIIEPRMSFGTGHHPTTWLMINEMLNLNLENLEVLDFGAGTGVLSILAEKKLAKKVIALDNDPNAIANIGENLILNDCHKIDCQLSDLQPYSDLSFDVILANVTRNVVLERIDSFAKMLKPQGKLVCSGFVSEDNHFFENKLRMEIDCPLQIVNKAERENWGLITFEKSV